MYRYFFLLLVPCIFMVTSCKSRDKASEINYMQNMEQLAAETAMRTALPTIQKGDILQVFVSAKDMDVVKPFNQNYFSQSSPAAPNTTPSVEKQYIVNTEGNIDFPVIGLINTEGKTVEAVKAELTGRISDYVKEPHVSLKLVNFKVTILGEIARPGQYTIPEGQTTLLNAIGLAGDLTIYGKRQDILIVRNENGTLIKQRVDLMDAGFFNSPFFQLKQGDVIYVSANHTKDKIARLDPNTGTYIAIAGTLIGLAGIFITIFK